MKGQIFILISILVLVALVIMRNSIKPIMIESKPFLYENFLNLKNELIKTVDISILNEENIAPNLDNFISFSKECFKNRGYNETVTYSISTIGNTRTVYMNVSLKLQNSFIEDEFIINRTVYS